MDEPLYLNREQAAEAIGVTPPTLDKLIRRAGEHFVHKRGSNGDPYQIDSDKLKAFVLAERLAEDEEKQRNRERVQQMEIELTGGSSVAGSENGAGLAVDHRLKLLNEARLSDAIRKERGELVEVARAEQAHERRLRFIADFLRSLPDILGRRLNWDAATVVECADTVEAVQERLARELMEARFLDDGPAKSA